MREFTMPLPCAPVAQQLAITLFFHFIYFYLPHKDGATASRKMMINNAKYWLINIIDYG